MANLTGLDIGIGALLTVCVILLAVAVVAWFGNDE